LKRIELHINAKNDPSRKSIEKYGGKLDGILRQNLRIYDNSFRDTAVYSILDSEWNFNKINYFPLNSETGYSFIY
jgi:N-acetyltransferase